MVCALCFIYFLHWKCCKMGCFSAKHFCCQDAQLSNNHVVHPSPICYDSPTLHGYGEWTLHSRTLRRLPAQVCSRIRFLKLQKWRKRGRKGGHHKFLWPNDRGHSVHDAVTWIDTSLGPQFIIPTKDLRI